MSMYFRGRDYETAGSGPPLDRKIITIMWTFARPFRGLMLLALGVMLLGTAADLARPYLLKVAIDTQIIAGDLAGLYATARLYAVTIAVSIVLSYAQTMLLQYIGQQIIFAVRQKVFRHLIYQRHTDIEGQPVGRIVTRVTSDTDALKDLYTDVIVAFASDLLVIVGIVGVMLAIDWRLALVCFTVLPIMAALAALYQKYARQAFRQVREKTAVINSFLQETMNGIGVVKAFARFRRSEDEYAAVNREYLAAGLREMRTFALFRPMVDLVYTLSVVLILWFSGWQSTWGGMDIGVVVAFLRYMEKFFWPIKDLAEKYSLLQSALAAAERIYDLLAQKRPEEEPLRPSPERSFAGSITFEDVWFAYEEPHWVLEGMSFSVAAGRFIGIAGLSGAGKSTVISLLLRFQEPQRGRIMLDGTDIRELPLDTLRRKIGVVFQDVHLFSGTVADNIRLFDPAIASSDIVAAAVVANAHEFIMRLPRGYDTPIGYQGAMLSAGQRQLLSLARVLACRADVLVLDEATSSIDGETEQLIQDALTRIAKERTMIVVAHRLSTIQAADSILVLDHGRVAEQGGHEELLMRQGLYWRLYNSQ